MAKKAAKTKAKSQATTRRVGRQELPPIGGLDPLALRLLEPKVGKPGSPRYEAAKAANLKNLASGNSTGKLPKPDPKAFWSSGLPAHYGREKSLAENRSEKWLIDQRKVAIAEECEKLDWARTDQLVRLIDRDREDLEKLFDNGEFGTPIHTPAGFMWGWNYIKSRINWIYRSGNDINRRSEGQYDTISSFFESYIHRKISDRTKQLMIIFDNAQQASDALLAQIADLLSDKSQAVDVGLGEGSLLKQMPDNERLAPPSVYWKERKNHPELKNATLPEFLRVVYGSRLGRGFTRADLRSVDEGLYAALKEWQRRADPQRPGSVNQLPADIDLPTLEEWHDRQLDASGLSKLIEDKRYRNILAVAASRSRLKHP